MTVGVGNDSSLWCNANLHSSDGSEAIKPSHPGQANLPLTNKSDHWHGDRGRGDCTERRISIIEGGMLTMGEKDRREIVGVREGEKESER